MNINYADPTFDRETANRVYYGTNLARLKKIKAKHNLTSLFYHSQSVKPAKKSTGPGSPGGRGHGGHH